MCSTWKHFRLQYVGKAEQPSRSLPAGTEMNPQNHGFPYLERLPMDGTVNKPILLSSTVCESAPTCSVNFCLVLPGVMQGTYAEDSFQDSCSTYETHVLEC